MCIITHGGPQRARAAPPQTSMQTSRQGPGARLPGVGRAGGRGTGEDGGGDAGPRLSALPRGSQHHGLRVLRAPGQPGCSSRKLTPRERPGRGRCFEDSGLRTDGLRRWRGRKAAFCASVHLSIIHPVTCPTTSLPIYLGLPRTRSH